MLIGRVRGASRRSRIAATAAAALSVAAGMPSICPADSWDNTSGDASWSNATNWLDNTEPNAAAFDSVDFPPGFPNADTTITLSSGEYALSLSISDSYTFTGGSLLLSSGNVGVALGKTATINSVITGSFGLNKSGAGTLVLGGANTFSGGVVSSGTLVVNADNRLGDPTNSVSINSGSFITTGSFSSARVFALGSSSPFIAPAVVTTLTLTGGLTGAGVLTMNGAGTLALNAAASRSAQTGISSGVVRMNHNSGLGTGFISITNSGDLELTNGITISQPAELYDQSQIRVLSGTATYAGNIIMQTGADAVISSGTGGTLSIGDATHGVSGSGATLNIAGSAGGVIALPFGNLGYTGNWSINTGTLRVSHPDALGSGGTVNVQGTLELAGLTLNRNFNLNTIGTLSGTGSAASNGVVTIGNFSNTKLSTPSASDTLTIGNAANDLTGGLNASLFKTGAGKVVLAQSSNFQGSWVVQQGTLRVDHAAGLGASNSVTVSGGTLEMAANVKIGSLHVSAGAVANLLANGNRTLQLNTLSIVGTGALDLNDNDLIVENETFTKVRALVTSGFGNTTGGITSSTSNGSQVLALFDNALVGRANWNGITVGANAIIGKYTYFGDANIDGQVTGDDYTVIDANLNTTPLAGLAWLRGDMNRDGNVTGDDYTIVDARLGLGVGNPLTSSAVPEPTFMAGLSAGVLCLLRRVRSRR
jgi:fibronectin-binding autotransporter adhesin